MKIKYVGGRKQYVVRKGRKPYYFNLENDRILETFDQKLVNHITKLSNSYDFEFVVEQPVIKKVEPTREEVKVEKEPKSKPKTK